MILVDANILMYAAGAAHAHKATSVQFLERVAEGEIDAVIDAEILQEILHRYRALQRWEEGRYLFDFTRALFPVVLPVTAEVLDSARILLDAYPHLMARDGVHAAVVLQHQLDGLCSFDRDFDPVAGVERVEPGPCTLRVWFDDGTVKDVDFTGELWGEVFEPLSDPEFFQQASVNSETGTVEWPNGADVAPGFLHERGVPV